MRLSALDPSVALDGHGEDEAIRDTLDLAQHCERFGFARFWLSELHCLPTILGSAPEVLMAAIAVCTRRIGNAGVMLPHCSALKVAEQFHVLEAVAAGLQLDHLVINIWAHDRQVRRHHSYALLEREFGLQAEAA